MRLRCVSADTGAAVGAACGGDSFVAIRLCQHDVVRRLRSVRPSAGDNCGRYTAGPMLPLRRLTPCFFALFAALCLIVAQPGALVHGWSHDLHDDHAAHAHAAGAAHVAPHGDHDLAGHHHGDEESAWALCELCAHYSAVVHVPGASAANSLVLPQGAFPRPVLDPPARGLLAAAPYAARAPPSLLS